MRTTRSKLPQSKKISNYISVSNMHRLYVASCMHSYMTSFADKYYCRHLHCTFLLDLLFTTPNGIYTYYECALCTCIRVTIIMMLIAELKFIFIVFTSLIK